ncbi:MAG: hypothetical protein E6Q88_08040 [Lysobacteraceae bacterium]|nr:MAG: hypothetical protein E6Q88_08040 [Xanthomonadaceae bacterium]
MISMTARPANQNSLASRFFENPHWEFRGRGIRSEWRTGFDPDGEQIRERVVVAAQHKRFAQKARLTHEIESVILRRFD